MGSIKLKAVNRKSKAINSVVLSYAISGGTPVSVLAASVPKGGSTPTTEFRYRSGSNDRYLMQFATNKVVRQAYSSCNVGTETSYVTIELYDDFYNVRMDGSGDCKNKSYDVMKP